MTELNLLGHWIVIQQNTPLYTIEVYLGKKQLNLALLPVLFETLTRSRVSWGQ